MADSAQSTGRPPIVATPEEFERLVDEYRDICKRDKQPVTFTGMALHLGFASRQSFYDYEKRPGFSYPVRKARTLVENEYEKRLSSAQVAGAIFALKNSDWSDKHEHALTGADGGALEVTVTRRVVEP